MSQRTATIESLPMAFEVVKAMRADGLGWGEGYRPLGRFASAWEETYPKAVACLRNDLDDLLTCFRYPTLAERRRVRTTNAIERRFREVRRRTRPMGTFQDRTSMDRILFAVFIHENKAQGVRHPSLPDT